MENCKYWTQQDILHIYKHQNDDPYSLDSLALRASMWGSGMSQNYHPVKFIPKEVKLVDGKFYVWTEKWKWVEVPFSHDVLWDQKRELGRVDDGDWEQYLGPYAINKEINENMKNTVKLNEAQLKKVVAESVKRVLREMEDIPEFDNVDNSDIAQFNGNYNVVIVPDWCLPYLVNGDTEGYNEEEIQAMHEFERKWHGKLLNGLNIGDICIPLEGRDPSFRHHNDVLDGGGSNTYRFFVPLK